MRKLKDYNENYFSNLSVAGIIARVIGVVVVLTVVIGAIVWGLSWANAGKDIVGPANAKQQSYQVRDKWQSMLTTAQNACQAQQQTKQDPNLDPQLVESPALAYAAQYRNIRSQFNRLQQNPFENGLTHWGGYPTRVPIFPAETRVHPNYCALVTDLQRLHE